VRCITHHNHLSTTALALLQFEWPQEMGHQKHGNSRDTGASCIIVQFMFKTHLFCRFSGGVLLLVSCDTSKNEHC
jgi:hypothetical protein